MDQNVRENKNSAQKKKSGNKFPRKSVQVQNHKNYFKI